MHDVAAELVRSLVDAFAPYVRRRLDEQGLGMSGVPTDTLQQGETWLRLTLDGLLNLPFAEQRRGPLEVFQEAMRFPTEALTAAGKPAPPRDPGAVAALPGDKYNLAPASSRLLGEEVWMAHLAWGAAKARGLGRSRLVWLLSDDLMDRSRIEPLVVGSGAEFVAWTGRSARPVLADGALPDLVLVDLALQWALDSIEELSTAGVRVIAFGAHIDRVGLRQARQAGADEVLARSAFFVKLGDFLG